MGDEAQRRVANEAQRRVAELRRNYRRAGLAEESLAADPMTQFARWFDRAVAAMDDVDFPEPNAMVLTTTGRDCRPVSRMVLLKGYDTRGFVFFTNYDSRKGRQLAENPHCGLLFPWLVLQQQVVVTGTARRVGREETDAYFATRPHGSKLGAWASPQSAVVTGREELERSYAELAERYPEGTEVPAPPHWGGFRVVPDSVEFWQGRANRLHDRLRYVRTERPGGWRVERLAP